MRWTSASKFAYWKWSTQRGLRIQGCSLLSRASAKLLGIWGAACPWMCTRPGCQGIHCRGVDPQCWRLPAWGSRGEKGKEESEGKSWGWGAQDLGMEFPACDKEATDGNSRAAQQVTGRADTVSSGTRHLYKVGQFGLTLTQWSVLAHLFWSLFYPRCLN